MAKYSKAAGKSVKSAVKRMKKGTLTSGNSGKKVTSKKQAIAIGLSEAREKGAKVPAKKTAAKKTAAKKAAPKKTAAKKKSAPKKKVAAKKTAAKKSNGTSSEKAPAKKAVPARPAGGAAGKKSAPAKSPAKKAASKKQAKRSAAPKAASKSTRKESPSRSKAKMPGETSDTGEFISSASTPPDHTPVTNSDINNEVTPETENNEAVFAGTTPDQQYIPADFKASTQDPYHGNINPSKAKTSQKPSGKKPLWDNRK